MCALIISVGIIRVGIGILNIIKVVQMACGISVEQLDVVVVRNSLICRNDY